MLPSLIEYSLKFAYLFWRGRIGPGLFLFKYMPIVQPYEGIWMHMLSSFKLTLCHSFLSLSNLRCILFMTFMGVTEILNRKESVHFQLLYCKRKRVSWVEFRIFSVRKTIKMMGFQIILEFLFRGVPTIKVETALTGLILG